MKKSTLKIQQSIAQRIAKTKQASQDLTKTMHAVDLLAQTYAFATAQLT